MEVDLEEDIDGCIHSIHVKNFFCHENLEITLNRNVNFIVGRNGSGKSAILTALIVGLGGRASATNRGNNLHSFIKKGTNSATVEIKIKNNSANAYKHHVYGDYITIVRSITASGSSGYKIKSHTGDVISTKFEEVNAIITAHDIQVDNPISVLNQDDARSFHASDAKKKYSLFRKATNLDQTERNYQRALENCEKASSIWDRKKEASLELEKELKKWETSYEQLQSRDEFEADKRRLQDEYYWSELAEIEKDANSLQVLYDKHKAHIDKLVDKLKVMEQSFENNSDTINTLQSSLKEKSEKKASLEREFHQLEGEVRDVQAQWRASQNTAAKQRELLNREKRKVADLEREINNINSESAASHRSGLEARAQATAQAAAAVRARYDTAQNDAEQARLNSQRAMQAAEECTSRVQRQRNTLTQLKMQLRELESRGTDSLAVYGNNMVDLCQRIKEVAQRGGFSTMPRGPVGAYLKVKEKKWASTLEHIIGGSIQSFCVNTPEDSRTLFQLMGKVYGGAPKPGVTCSKFINKQHNVDRNKVRAAGYRSALDSLDVADPVIANFLIDNIGVESILLVPEHVMDVRLQVRAAGYRSALDSLDVADPVIANFLIDNIGVESILLVPEHEDAVRLTDNVENVPLRCSKVVTLDNTEYHPAPNYRCYGGSNRPSRVLQVSTADRKRQVQEEIRETEASLSALQAAVDESGRSSQAAKEGERAATRALQALLSERHERDAAARAAQAALDQQQAPHHRVLLEELEVSKEKLSSINEKLESHTEQERGHRERADSYDTRVRDVKGHLARVITECRSINEKLDQEQLRLEQGVTEQQTQSLKLQEDQRKLAQARLILEGKRALIQEKTNKALELCPRVNNPREKAIVMSELNKMQMILKSIRSDGLTKNEVAERLIQIQRKYRKTKQMLDKLNTLIEEVKKTTDKHLNFCYRVQSYIGKRVQYCFQSILTLRGYSGSMVIDSAKGTLDMRCSGRESSSRRSAAGSSSLSGGERSYSTVAFIMALWECVELPFYFMDEFDVFMDNVNRKIVMELLIDHALKNTTRQFVFLTPQDASSVTSGPLVKIHRMADPRQ